MIKHVVSVSGGKDSLATLLLAIERFGTKRLIPIFCDTGNEHGTVYKYLSYLEKELGVEVVRLRAEFSAEIQAKRRFIARDNRTRREYATEPVVDAAGNPVPQRDAKGRIVTKNGKPVQKTKKVGGGRKIRWTNKAKRRALAVLHPTGNPFLDLCLWKGRFPSRRAQFCTEELKRNIAIGYQMELIDAGYHVVSWQGIRRDESINRQKAMKFERVGPALYTYRPILEWTAEQVFDYCSSHGIKPNPLYLQGMGRVGCMPCINCGKDEIRQIAARFPLYLEEKERWERLVGTASKRGKSTFFNKELHESNDKNKNRLVYEANKVESVLRWANTSRGGKQYDLLASNIDSTVCASAYGLCE